MEEIESSDDLNELISNEDYSFELVLNKIQATEGNLDALRKKLTEQLQVINQLSEDYLEKNYLKFYELASAIDCISTAIQKLYSFVENFHIELASICQKHKNYIDEINLKLDSLKDTSHNKEAAKTLIVYIKRRDRLEETMKNIDWSAELDTPVKCDSIERVHVSLNYLINQVDALKPTNDQLIKLKTSFLQNLKQRQVHLDNWLEETFLKSKETKNDKLTELVNRTYKQTDSIQRLQKTS